MTSSRQIAANRRNAQRSTGPRTQHGKERSRRNALRHGLTAETVITALEEATKYNALQADLFAGFAPTTVVERELVARLASLFWRLRRATAVETGLFTIQADIQRERRAVTKPEDRISQTIRRMMSVANEAAARSTPNNDRISEQQVPFAEDIQSGTPLAMLGHEERRVASLAQCFLRLANLNGEAVDRVGRYEARLWKQAAQILLLLRHSPSLRS